MTFAAGNRLFASELNAIDGSPTWQTWSPTLTALTLGNGAVTARYWKVGKTVHFRFKFKLGSTSAVGTGPAFTLPFAPHGSIVTAEDQVGDAFLLDAGTATRRGGVRLTTGSTVEIIRYDTTGVQQTITATTPHTWAVNDTLSCTGTYETA